MPRLLMVSLIFFPLLACKRSEEVAPAQPTVAPVEVGGHTYVKPEGMLFDVLRIVGRPVEVVEGTELGAQLGAMLEEIRLPGVRGIETRYEHATLRVARGVIYSAVYTFDPPVNRVLALQQLGMPGGMGPMRVRQNEFRIERPRFGVRRVVMTRVSPDSDDVSQVEVWSLIPNEIY